MKKKRIWEDYLPKSTYLYDIDARSFCENHLETLQCVVAENETNYIWDDLLDYEVNYDYDLSLLKDKLLEHYPAEQVEQTLSEDKDDIQSAFDFLDRSDPIEQITSHSLTCFYETDIEADFSNYSWGTEERCEAVNATIKKISQVLHVTNTDDIESIGDLVSWVSSSGELRIYFRAPIKSLLTHGTANETITFNGNVWIGLWNPTDGSGDVIPIKINTTFQFIRTNLYISEYGQYDVESGCGLIPDWLNNTVTPQFDLPNVEPIPVTDTHGQEARAHLSALIKTFNAGGCTFGDMDINRHRDLIYINHFPCGLKCPHCGTFFID